MKTITSLLYADETAGRLDLENRLRELPALQTVLMWPGILTAITTDILEFLRMPVGDLAISAYQRFKRIEDAKQETAKSLGRTVVQLMDHEIENKIEPRIEVEINGVVQTLLELELAAKLSVESVTAVVEAGRLVDIAPGSATASVTLSAAGLELAKAETQPVDLSVPEEARIVVDLTAVGEPIIDRLTVTGPQHSRQPQTTPDM